MAKARLIALSIAAIVIVTAVVFAFIAWSPSGDDGIQPFDGVGGRMVEGRIQVQVPEDVMIVFESESEVPAGKQAQVVLKVLEKQTSKPMEGAEVIIGIEKGLPMTTMDMIGGMFNAADKGNGVYSLTFTPESEGYYTIHVHVIPPGRQMHSMMEDHVDFVIISR